MRRDRPVKLLKYRNLIFLLLFSIQAFFIPYETQAQETPILECHVSYAGSTEVVQVKLTENLYDEPIHDIGGRFSFKALMHGKLGNIDYIKLYAYFQGRDFDIPIHQATYLKPFPIKKGKTLLTPMNYLYAGEVEREMQYQCFLIWSRK
ncbi:hypothetical protein [Undibacterium fentianense]|uniref:Uncharacterized protein n=1 Tax=Undibacterium fentianense TaxID=2828728 RepID=A0A941IGQ8_9BURK|nr:hypothetical protein [Undibacterium fentianense]MBR7800250.1 hypothetical protein [Undibacterium fentianense]